MGVSVYDDKLVESAAESYRITNKKTLNKMLVGCLKDRSEMLMLECHTVWQMS